MWSCLTLSGPTCCQIGGKPRLHSINTCGAFSHGPCADVCDAPWQANARDVFRCRWSPRRRQPRPTQTAHFHGRSRPPTRRTFRSGWSPPAPHALSHSHWHRSSRATRVPIRSLAEAVKPHPRRATAPPLTPPLVRE
jgi:hypothetical protein